MTFDRLQSQFEKRQSSRVGGIGVGLVILSAIVAILIAEPENVAKNPAAKWITLCFCWVAYITFFTIRAHLVSRNYRLIDLTEQALRASLPGSRRCEQRTKWGTIVGGDDWIGSTFKPLTALWVHGQQIEGVVRGCDRWRDAKMLRNPDIHVPTVEQLAGHWLMILSDKPGAELQLISFDRREDCVYWFNYAIALANSEHLPVPLKPNIWNRGFMGSDKDKRAGAEAGLALSFLLYTVWVTFWVLRDKGARGGSSLIFTSQFFYSPTLTAEAISAGQVARACYDFWGKPSLLTDKHVFGPAGGNLYLSRKDFVLDIVALTDIREITVKSVPLSIWERQPDDWAVKTKSVLCISINRDHDSKLEFDLPAEQAHRICDAVQLERES